jgi:hypothetical protein
VKLQDSNTQPPVGVWPSDIGSLAFALDEFFDVLDALYLDRNGIRRAFARNDRLVGLCGATSFPNTP